ncbi:alpha/beta fold hydrolase [Nocardia sp. NPDC003482]
MTTYTLHLPEVDLVYDVHGPLPTGDGRPPLLMIGQPMAAGGFRALAAHFPERTVVTYDPRGLGRSVRTDGRTDNSPTTQAADLHALIRELGAGPVEIFASSGGAITGLALVAAHPDDVLTLVAHEPPLIRTLPDADLALRIREQTRDAYRAKGSGAGMAVFLASTMWQGEFTEEFFDRPIDPAQFGLPSEDDGSRDDPLLSESSWAVTDYEPDIPALTAAPTRIVFAVGEETGDTLTARTTIATAALLDLRPVVFPSHHGGFADGESGYPGQPAAFARALHRVLDERV